MFIIFKIVTLEDLNEKKEVQRSLEQDDFNSNNSKIVFYEDESCVGESQNSDTSLSHKLAKNYIIRTKNEWITFHMIRQKRYSKII
jgi:hypothetical protein